MSVRCRVCNALCSSFRMLAQHIGTAHGNMMPVRRVGVGCRATPSAKFQDMGEYFEYRCPCGFGSDAHRMGEHLQAVGLDNHVEHFSYHTVAGPEEAAQVTTTPRALRLRRKR